MNKKSKGKKIFYNYILYILPYIPIFLIWLFWTEPTEELRALSSSTQWYLALTLALYIFASCWATWCLDKADEEKLKK